MQDAVEAGGGDGLALAPAHLDGGQEVGERGDLFVAGLVVDAVDLRAVLLLQRLGGADIGLDHEFFDELVRIEPLAPLHAGDFAVFEDDLVLGRVDLERLALLARVPCAGVSGPERFEDGLKQRLRFLVGLAVDRSLRLLVGELRRRAHQSAHEFVAASSGLRASNTISTARQARSSFSRSEQRSAESDSGSIGATRSGK